jgi:hypothetical protein
MVAEVLTKKISTLAWQNLNRVSVNLELCIHRTGIDKWC